MITTMFLFLISTMLTMQDPPSDADRITGVWLNTQKDAKVEIFQRSDGMYYGKITWLAAPNEKDGTLKADIKNPEEALRSTPLIGLVVLKNFRYEGDEWVGGVKYDYKTGRSFKCTITLKDDVLDIQGTSGWTHRHDKWTRINP